jgi:hypothetical protein
MSDNQEPGPPVALPVVQLPAAIVAALTALGWRDVSSNIEDTYIEHDLVLEHVDPDKCIIGSLGYSIEPSGNHGGLIVHRGDSCDGPVFAMRPYSPAGIPPAVVVAAVTALQAHDATEIGRRCPARGLVIVRDCVIREGGDLHNTYDAVCTVCGRVGTSVVRADAETIAAGHRSPDPEREPSMPSTGHSPAGPPDDGDQETWDPDGSGDTHYGVEAGGYPLPPAEPAQPDMERYLIDRAEHDAHADDAPEPEE